MRFLERRMGMKNAVLGFVVGALLVLVGGRIGIIPGVPNEMDIRAISRGQLMAADARSVIFQGSIAPYVKPEGWAAAHKTCDNIVDEGDLAFRCFVVQRSVHDRPAGYKYRIFNEDVLIVYTFRNLEDAKRLASVDDSPTNFSTRKDVYVLARRFSESHSS